MVRGLNFPGMRVWVALFGESIKTLEEVLGKDKYKVDYI